MRADQPLLDAYPVRAEGIYRSTDGGRTWQNKALAYSQHLARIAIHPQNLDILYAATYEKVRLPWHYEAGGPGSAIYKTVDAGKTWTHLAGGLPTGKIGRIGNYQFLGDSHLLTPNEPNAMVINFFLRDTPRDRVRITVADPYGQVMWETTPGAKAGFNRVLWDMRLHKKQDESRRFEDDWNAPWVNPGEYMVTLEASGKKLVQKAVIKKRMGWAIGPFPVTIEE